MHQKVYKMQLNFTVSKLMAPLLVSGMSRKVVTQLPPFEQWRLKSVTDPNPS